MVLKIADLLPQPDKVELGGQEIELYPLGLSQLSGLLNQYRDVFVALYSAAQSGGDLDYSTFIAGAPDLVADIIAISARIQGQEEDVKRIPAALQLTALVKIWNLSVPDVKSLAQSLSGVTDGLRKLSEVKPPVKVLPQTDSTEA